MFVSPRRRLSRLACFVLAMIGVAAISAPATLLAEAPASQPGGEEARKKLDEQLYSQVRSIVSRSEELGRARAAHELEALARNHATSEIAPRAMLEAAELHARNGDFASAVLSLRQIVESLPDVQIQPWCQVGAMREEEAAEYGAYVAKHTMSIRSYAQFEMGNHLVKLERHPEALEAFTAVLAKAPPQPLPDTNNRGVRTVFRLHHEALLAKIYLLRKMKREAEMSAAQSEYDRIYKAGPAKN